MESRLPDFRKSKGDNPSQDGRGDRVVVPLTLSQDPDYKALIESYQDADFSKCQEVLERLEERYGNDPVLLKFEEDLQLKMMVQTMEDKKKKENKKERLKTTFNFGVLIVAIVAILGTIIYFTIQHFSQQNLENQQAQELIQLNAMADQAAQLVQVGKPQEAADIIEDIRAVNPDFDRLPALTTDIEALLSLNNKYQEALQLSSEGNLEEAKALFIEIQDEQPDLWDVSQQIAVIESETQLTDLLTAGNSAYQNRDWDVVISSYESALMLDSQLDDPQITEQLLQAYLQQIIEMLQLENVSIEEIETAEQYYRKAVALIPQSRTYANERENLQEVSSNLLQLKYSQTAVDMLADSDQTLVTVKKAVSYLSKAVNITPENQTLQSDLANARLYQAAFQEFLNQNWARVITNLENIVEDDPGFAGDKVMTMLFESYNALGQQYDAAGFYQDAIINYEQAELVVWEDTGNLMRLFQVQLNLGETYGKLEDFENAVSYYLYAFNMLNESSSVDLTPVASLIAEANNRNVLGDFETAYNSIQTALESVDQIYTMDELAVVDGVCLAFFAADHQSTLDAIIDANNLSNVMVINVGRIILVPTLQN
jgi:tetratricopeptide (TPR) repeat protein